MFDKIEKRYAIFGLIVGIAVLLDLFQIVDFPSWIRVTAIILFGGIWTFTAGIHAKQLWENDELDPFLKFSYAPLIVIILVLDVLFNFTAGTLIFRELPRALLFTDRVKRHYRDVTRKGKPQGSDYRAAERWARRLNWIDPGHVRP